MGFSLILPILVTAAGLFLLIKLRFFFIIHPIRTAKEFLWGLSDRDARRSFFLALAGTLGVGNIFGVSAGIMIGGAGSLFWLFLSSVFSAVIKYAEVLLVFDTGTGKGGMADLLSQVHKKAKIISPLYAGLTVALSLLMGAAMQTSAVCDIAGQTVGLISPVTSFILVILLLPAFIGDARKIENITEIIIPLTTIIYISMCFCIIFSNFERLPEVISRVITSAFSFRSAAGGVTAVAIKEGFARGILSNEAGVGTSALAHARSSKRPPHLAGLFGMCEVAFDTTILCTLTGLSILLSIDDPSVYKTPMALVFAAFRLSLGEASVLLLPLIFAFAYSTIICWFYYGDQYSRLYFGKISKAFPFVFVAFILFAQLLPSSLLLYFTDLILLIMACLTLSAIVKRSGRIAEISLKRG